MVRILLVLIFSFFFWDVYSQNADTLNKTEIPAAEPKDALYYQRQAKRESNPNLALELSKKALSLRSSNQDENWIADVKLNMASSLLQLGRSKEAFSEFLTAERIYTKTGNISSRAKTLSLMAKFYERNAAWKDALYYYQSAQLLQQSIEEFGQAAMITLHLTDISLVQNNLTDAGRHVSYAIRQFEKLNDKTGLGLSYVKQAEIFRRQEQYKSAESLILKSALPFFRSTGYEAGRIDCFDVLGKIYRSQKRYSEAKWFFIQANTQSRKLNDVEGIITSLVNLGKVKVQIDDYSLARRDFKEAQSLASQHGNLFLMAEVKDAYAFLYKKTGNQSGFEDVNESSEELKDSLDNYLTAQAESARAARVQVSALRIKEKKRTIQPARDDQLLAEVIAGSLGILIIILLILRKLK